MQLSSLWSGFTNIQYSYITDIISHSDAKSVCELGTFVGTTAKHIWNSIRDTDKKLYLVDNYLFLPENKRKKFFNTVKFTIDADTDKIITVLEDSHSYAWTNHDFVFFGHHDADHMLPDLQKLIDSDVNYAIIGDGVPGCFRRTKAVFEFLSNKNNHGFDAQYYLDGLIVLGRKQLKCTLPTVLDNIFSHPIRYIPKNKTNYERAINELTKIY